MYKSLVLLSLLLSVLFLGQVIASENAKDFLSKEERKWLIENESRIVLAIETGYAPFAFVDSRGQPIGLTNDYIEVLQSKLGIKFKQKHYSSLNEIFTAVRSGEVHIVNAVTKTTERSKFLNFTEPFISVPNVIVTRKDQKNAFLEKTLSGVHVALVKDYAVTEYLLKKNPEIKPDLVSDDLTALLRVSFGQSEAAVIDLASATYLIVENGITNLSVASEIDFHIRLSMAASTQEPILQNILSKGLMSISQTERNIIKDRWINVSNNVLFFDWRLWTAVGFTFGFILLVIIWNYVLRLKVNERTKKLTLETNERKQIEERMRFAFDSSHIGAWHYDFGDHKSTYSLEYGRIFGFKEVMEDWSVESFCKFVIPEDREKIREIIQLALNNKKDWSVECQIRRGDGEVRWVWLAGHQGEQNLENTYIGGIVQDITERKQSEERLKKTIMTGREFLYQFLS